METERPIIWASSAAVAAVARWRAVFWAAASAAAIFATAGPLFSIDRAPRPPPLLTSLPPAPPPSGVMPPLPLPLPLPSEVPDPPVEPL